MAPQPLATYLLAGGKSTRFGRDKARALLDGEALLVRLARAAQPMAQSVTVVADQPHKYADLGLATIADVRPALGPIGGLWTALLHAQRRGGEQWVLLASCDMLELRPAWVRRLQEHAAPGRAAVAFKAERWHPLPGLYHTALLALIERQVAAGERAMWKLLDAVGGAAVALPGDWPTIAQANTPADLERYEAQRKDE